MTDRTRDESLLDNPVWHSLRGPLSRFSAAESTPEWPRFDPEIGVFGGVEEIDESVWRRIAEMAGLEGVCGLFRDAIESAPPGWEELFRGTTLQMVAADLAGAKEVGAVLLGEEDGEEMLALAQLTEPGPYLLRTRELGRYVGVRREGQLVAMAGERFRVPGFVEISAVCTHPDARGHGLAASLTLNVAQSIRAGGDEAFLHVLDTNEGAIRLYEKLGFRVRRKVEVVFVQWHGPDWIPSEAESESE